MSQTMFMLSIAINRAEHVCATVIIKHNYMLMCNHKTVINIMLCLLTVPGIYKSRSIVDLPPYDKFEEENMLISLTDDHYPNRHIMSISVVL